MEDGEAPTVREGVAEHEGGTLGEAVTHSPVDGTHNPEGQSLGLITHVFSSHRPTLHCSSGSKSSSQSSWLRQQPVRPRMRQRFSMSQKDSMQLPGRVRGQSSSI